MKKITKILIFLIFILNLNNLYAYTLEEKLAADFLSYKDIINSQENTKNYKLDQQITRREMAKVTLKLYGKYKIDGCSGLFSDLKAGDWGCKYAESGVSYGFFAPNKYFRPDANISKIEALKMIMKARNINKEKTEDWREGYVNTAVKIGLLEKEFTDYDTKARRGWIFILAQNAIEFSSNDEDIKIIEDLLNP